MSDTTEHSILSNIPDFADEGTSDATTTNTNTTQQTNQGTDNTQRSTSAQPTTTNQPGSGTDKPAQQQQAFRRRHDGLIEQPNTDNPRVRDLVDPITGRVVAQGGIERRVFEEGQRHARENTQLQQKVQQLNGFVQSVNEVTREAARLNIKPEDQLVAMRVMADFMRDPVKTVEYLIAEVKAKGYPLPFLEAGINPGIDMTAIARMIDTKMQPFTQQQQNGQRQQQARQQAENELNGFLSDNADAEQNLDVLTEMLQAQPTLTIQSAYTKMIRWAHENGLDWTQPLRPQIAAQQDGNSGQQPTHQQTTQQTNQRPLPGSRNVRNGPQPINKANGGAAQFNENSSWGDIIRDSMMESGVQLN